MHKLIKNIWRVLGGRDDLGDKLDLSTNDRDAHVIGGRFARGNVPAQHGRYVSPDDLERERRRMAKHAF